MYREIKRARFNDDLTIDVVWDNGKAKRFNMRKFIENSGPKAFVRELLDINLFQNPQEIDSSFISWNWRADIYWDWLYIDGVDIEPFEDGIKATEPDPIDKKFRMLRARFNDDLTIDVVFELKKARRYNMLKEIERTRDWHLGLRDLKIFKNPDTFTHKVISWSNGSNISSYYIYKDGIPIPLFEGGIEREL